jgi:hypothetical protein
MFSRRLDLSALTFWITPGSVVVFVGCAAMAPSGNAAPMAKAAAIFMSIDVFIVSSFRAPRLLGTVPPSPLASPMPVSLCKR